VIAGQGQPPTDSVTAVAAVVFNVPSDCSAAEGAKGVSVRVRWVFCRDDGRGPVKSDVSVITDHRRIFLHAMVKFGVGENDHIWVGRELESCI